jgi:soluble lytic murein transglycosylase-like protein
MTQRGVCGAALGGEGARQAIGTRCTRAATVLLALGLIAAAATAASANQKVYSFRDRRGTQHFTNVPTDTRYKPVPIERRVMRISYTPKAGRNDRASSRTAFARADAIWSPPPADLEKMIDDTARRYGVDPALVHAVVRAESAFDHLAVSSAGAQGLMQLMPGTALEVGVRDPFHPRENLEGGVYYLAQLLDRFQGNTQLALAGYNAGPGAVERYGGVPPYSETLQYIERVFRYRQEYLLNKRTGGGRHRVMVASR